MRWTECFVRPYHLVSYSDAYLTALDLTISSLVTYRLIRARVYAKTRTRRLINKLIVITFEAAIPPAVKILLALVLLWFPVRVLSEVANCILTYLTVCRDITSHSSPSLYQPNTHRVFSGLSTRTSYFIKVVHRCAEYSDGAAVTC